MSLQHRRANVISFVFWCRCLLRTEDTGARITWSGDQKKLVPNRQVLILCHREQTQFASRASSIFGWLLRTTVGFESQCIGVRHQQSIREMCIDSLWPYSISGCQGSIDCNERGEEQCSHFLRETKQQWNAQIIGVQPQRHRSVIGSLIPVRLLSCILIQNKKIFQIMWQNTEIVWRMVTSLLLEYCWISQKINHRFSTRKMITITLC